MNNPDATVLGFISVITSGIFLVILGYYDLKSREIPDNLVYAYLVTSLTIFAATTVFVYNCYPLVLLLAYPSFSVALTASLMYVLYRMRYMGEGDFYVTLSTGLAHAYPVVYTYTLQGRGVLPPGLLIVLYASLAIIFYATLTAIINLAKYRKQIGELPGVYKLLVPFLAKPIGLENLEREIHRLTYLYPVEYFEIEKGTIERKFKLSTRVDAGENLEITIKLLKLAGRSYIWVSTGQPFVFYMLAGLALFVVLGDTPVLALFTTLL